MATQVLWNEAAPPATQSEHMAAEWLVLIARRVGLVSVTVDNTAEWLWRFTFIQEMAGRRHHEYQAELKKFAVVLDRYRSVTLKGRVGDLHRDEFISEHIANRVECAREQADSAADWCTESAAT